MNKRLSLAAIPVLLAVLLAACGQVVTRPTTTPQSPGRSAPIAAATATARPTATPAPYTPAPTPTPTLTPTPVIYRIQAGDNLYIIASKFGVPHDLLRDVNGIENERTLQIGQALIIPLGGETGPLKPTPTATPTPLPAAVENVYFHLSPLEGPVALGEVYNAGDLDLEQVAVQIDLYDGQDQLLASASAYVALDVLAPGQRAPFVVRFAEPPERFATYDARILSALPAYLGSIHRDLKPVSVTEEQRPRAPLRLDGRILNVGPEEAVGVIVVATAYDPLGRVVGVRSSAPDHNVVARGGETSFHLEIVPAGPVVTYTIQAQGRRLLPTPAASGAN